MCVDFENYSEGCKINKPHCSLLLYWRIMPSAERLSPKIHICSCSFASQPTVHFLDNLSEGVSLIIVIEKYFVHLMETL